MSKFDDEFAAQLDSLRNNYDRTTEELEQTRTDARKLTALLVENGIPIPSDLLDRYAKRKPENDEDLPFD